MWLNLLFGILEVCTMTGGLYYFMSHIRHEMKRNRREYLLVFCVYACLIFVVILAEQKLRTNMLTIGFTFLYSMMVGYFMFSKKKTYLCYCGIYIVCVYCCQQIICMGVLQWYIRSHFTIGYGYGNLCIALKCIALLVLTKLLTFLVNRSEDKKVSRKKYWGIFLLPMFSLLFLYTLLSMGSIYLQFYGYGLFLLNVVALLFLNIYIIYLFYYVGKAGRLQNDLELQKQKSEMQFRYYEDLEEKYQSSRKLIHDMRNHLRAIEELYGNEEQEAKSYVEDLHQMLNKMGQTYYTDNRMLNIILNDKVKKAVQEGITVDVKIGNISLDGMKDVDITTIFANLLDNAIEAAVQAAGEKFIAIQAEKFHDFHIIKLTNTKRQECKKKGHMGIGLVNVRNALERYEGTMEIKEENEIYRTVITIPQV